MTFWKRLAERMFCRVAEWNEVDVLFVFDLVGFVSDSEDVVGCDFCKIDSNVDACHDWLTCSYSEMVLSAAFVCVFETAEDRFGSCSFHCGDVGVVPGPMIHVPMRRMRVFMRLSQTLSLSMGDL